MDIDFAPLNVLPATGTLVLFVTAEGGLGKIAADMDEKSDGALKRALDLVGEKIKRHPVELLCPKGLEADRLLLFCLEPPGEDGVFDPDKTFELESLGGRVGQKLAQIGVTSANLVLEALPGPSVNQVVLAQALGAGVRLRAYRFEKYRTNGEDDAKDSRLQSLTIHLADAAEAQERWPVTAAIAAGVEHGRDLVTEPANVLNPKQFAEECRKLEAEVGLEVEILDQAELEKLGMRALLGVAQGSVNEPYVAVMRWQGGPEDEAPVALIGKGVCFDTGGISLKPAGGMEEMKWDMGGAAAVFGAIKAIAGRKAKANVVAVLGLVENMPSGNAQRPGDVITAMSGTTIEVINTDAEGRLVLADILHYAKERFAPKAMIDMATLTGAVIVALGHEQAGLFSNDDALAGALSAAGETVGERVWRLPVGEAYAKHIKSEIADIKNTGRAREAGATAGAVFLQRFVGEVPWAHVDIAGVAWSKRDLPLAGKGATGFGIRLLDRLVADHYES
jgi:leucyl aminopeptidase